MERSSSPLSNPFASDSRAHRSSLSHPRIPRLLYWTSLVTNRPESQPPISLPSNSLPSRCLVLRNSTPSYRIETRWEKFRNRVSIVERARQSPIIGRIEKRPGSPCFLVRRGEFFVASFKFHATPTAATLASRLVRCRSNEKKRERKKTGKALKRGTGRRGDGRKVAPR